MKVLARLLLAAALTWLPLADASAAVVQITVKDAGGTTRSFNVTTNTDLTGNLDWNNVICDQAAGTTCASVGTAGSPSTNALTVQAVTLGHGTAANAMRVELPTDGTGLVNAAQSGTWNITNVSGTVSLPTGASTAAKQPALGTAGTASTDVLTVQGIVSMTPLLATLSGTNNINNVSGTISLPTGASTAAKQPALGTAGSASTDVLSIQGIASMTPLLANPGTAANWGVGTSTQNSSTVANGQLALAQFNTTPTTISSGNMSPLQLDSAGNLLVNIKAGAGSGGTAIADNAAFTTGTTSETPIGCYAGTPSATANHSTIVACTAAGSVHTTVDNTNANGSATSANSSPVVIASDQAAVAVKAAASAFASGALVDITNMSVATASAPPSKAIYLGANASGATGGQVAGLVTCDKHVFKHITSATDTLAVQGVASQSIRICGWRSRAAGTATWFLENTASTNANCSSSNTQITGVASEVANSGETVLASFWTGLANTSGNGLCINSTGTGGVDVDIWYNQF